MFNVQYPPINEYETFFFLLLKRLLRSSSLTNVYITRTTVFVVNHSTTQCDQVNRWEWKIILKIGSKFISWLSRWVFTLLPIAKQKISDSVGLKGLNFECWDTNGFPFPFSLKLTMCYGCGQTTCRHPNLFTSPLKSIQMKTWNCGEKLFCHSKFKRFLWIFFIRNSNTFYFRQELFRTEPNDRTTVFSECIWCTQRWWTLSKLKMFLLWHV